MLDVPAVRAWCGAALDALGRSREEIDALNVFPVADADTGTNLYLTLEAALDELDQLDRPEAGLGGHDNLAAALRALTHGALLGARGNSGVILSQLARGAVEAVVLVRAESPDADGAELLRVALGRAADAAYAAVERPVEGTILTVARAAADGAAATPGDAAAVVRAAARSGREALARTPQLLEQLRRAGVVDAGGRGLTILLDVLVEQVTGEHPASPPPRTGIPQPLVTEPGGGSDPDGPSYEVMYLLDAEEANLEALRAELAALGDSLLVVGGDGLWNVHVHADDVGAAVEAGLSAGRPYRIRVTHLGEQAARRAPTGLPPGGGGRVVVAMLPGGGLADIAVACGAVVVTSAPGDGRRPATRDLVEAVQAAHAQEVVVLPNASEVQDVAQAAAEWARTGGLRVAVLPTRSSVQVLAALAVHDVGRRFDDDVISMTSAARATRTGAVTVAVSEALTSAGVCRPGDVLGSIDEDVVVIGTDLGEVATTVLDRMLAGGGELVTVVVGKDGDDAARAVTSRLRRSRPEVELAVHHGGQELFPLLLGVE